jgi:hypothetical protein
MKIFPKQFRSVLVAPNPQQHLHLSIVCFWATLVGVKWYFIVIIMCISLIKVWVFFCISIGYVYMYLLLWSDYLFLDKCIVDIFSYVSFWKEETSNFDKNLVQYFSFHLLLKILVCNFRNICHILSYKHLYFLPSLFLDTLFPSTNFVYPYDNTTLS